MAYHYEHVSVTRFAKFDHLLQRLGKKDDRRLRADMEDKFSLLVRKRMLEVPLVPGAETFLQTIATKLPMYLASVTPAEELEEILVHHNLLHWFRNVYGCPPWTKPEAILDILNTEKISPSEALLIGDSAGDQRAAHETGIQFLGRDSGLPFDEPAPKQFPDMHELAEHLLESLL